MYLIFYILTSCEFVKYKYYMFGSCYYSLYPVVHKQVFGNSFVSESSLSANIPVK